ncbi:MAG: transglutaminase-like domain-containing protein [Candidatus Kariarchaeaceae archaeon]
MEIKTESELVISKKDVLLRKRIALRIPKEGLDAFMIDFHMPIMGVKGKDKFGKIRTTKVGESNVQVEPATQLKEGAYGVELSALVEPRTTEYGGMKVIDWPTMDLYKVLGFKSLILKEGVWEATNNISSGLTSHVASKRISRIELGAPPTYYLQGKLYFNCTEGGRIKSINLHQPQTNQRHQSTLLTPINRSQTVLDKQKNQRLLIEDVCRPGDEKTMSIDWKVQFLPIDHYQVHKLGEMKTLRMAIDGSDNLQHLLQPNSPQWDLEHGGIRKIAQAATAETSIFRAHRLLFEFCNRRLNYEINGIRIPTAEAFEKKIGDCSEFADLLVSLHRATGIPSRIKEGLIITKGTPEGHAWVEFLTQKGWIPCDPTWGLLLGVTGQHIELHTQSTGNIPNAYEAEVLGSCTPVRWDLRLM